MNADIFARWLQKQGHKVIKTESSYWYEAGPRSFQAFPYHWLIQPGKKELSNLMRQHKIITLRYSTPVQSPRGCISYHAVYDETEYILDGLDRRSRQNIRTGLRNCEVEPIPLERLAEEGWYLEEDTTKRQGRQLEMDQDAWRRRCLVAAGLPGFEAWGALVNGRLAASLLTCQVDDWCVMISQQCHHDFLRSRVNNALTFVVTKTMVDRVEIRSIFYALHSLDAPSSVDTFKFRMGYRAKPVRQQVLFHPWIQPFAHRFSHSVLEKTHQHYSSNRFWAKAEGMIRFNLQGNRPLGEQNWPECLEANKEQLLNNLIG